MRLICSRAGTAEDCEIPVLKIDIASGQPKLLNGHGRALPSAPKRAATILHVVLDQIPVLLHDADEEGES